MAPWDLWVLVTPFSWVLMSTNECSWVLMLPWHNAHECSYLVTYMHVSAHEHSWVIMRAQKHTLAAISAKSSHHRPWALMSMVPRCQMHSWPLISKHYHSCAWLQQHSWVLIAPRQHTYECWWGLLSTPEFWFSSLERSGALLSTPECLWVLLCAQVVDSKINKNVNFSNAFPVAFWKYLSPDFTK